MTKVVMHKCDFCEMLADSMNEGVLRPADREVEVRFEACDDCTEKYFGDLDEHPRRGRKPEEAAA